MTTVRISTRLDQYQAFGGPVLRPNPAKWILYQAAGLDQPRLPLQRIKVGQAARFHQTSQPLDMRDSYLLHNHYRGIFGLGHFGTDLLLGGTTNQTKVITLLDGGDHNRPMLDW